MIEERRAATDLKRRELDTETGLRLSSAFMIMGVFMFIALGAAILGTLRQSESKNLIGHNRFQRTIKYTLANYPTWNDFTTNCCCLEATTPGIKFNVTEQWVCRNGIVVSHGRVSIDGKDNSLLYRPVCSATVSTTVSSCAIVVTGNVAELSCSDTDYNLYVPSKVSKTAFKYYW